MLRTSCKLLIEKCYLSGLIDDERAKWSMKFIKNEAVHVEIRNLIMMILVPRKLHIDDETQAAYVRAAVARVSRLL